MGSEGTADMYEQDGVLVVEVGLSGVRFEDVSVRVHGAHLVVAARRTQKSGERRYHLRGRRAPQEFLQEVMLPPHACPDQATATYAHGLLRVCVPLGAESCGTPIEVEHLLHAYATKEEGPAGAGKDKGGVLPVPGSGVSRRCALCNKWMDGDGDAAPAPDAPATRIRYDLCPTCVPAVRRRDD